jgi:hypothetical protein
MTPAAHARLHPTGPRQAGAFAVVRRRAQEVLQVLADDGVERGAA